MQAACCSCAQIPLSQVLCGVVPFSDFLQGFQRSLPMESSRPCAQPPATRSRSPKNGNHSKYSHPGVDLPPHSPSQIGSRPPPVGAAAAIHGDLNDADDPQPDSNIRPWSNSQPHHTMHLWRMGIPASLA